VYFARSGRANTERYAYQANWRYTFQRVSGYLGVLFLFMHILSLRWGWTYGGIMPSFDADNAASSTALHLQGGFFPYFNAVFYLVCMLALVFHFANGLWTAGITWGVWVSPSAQKRASVACSIFGVLLGLAGLSSLAAVSRTDPATAKAIEDQMYKVRVDGHMIQPNEHKRSDGHHSGSSDPSHNGTVSANEPK